MVGGEPEDISVILANFEAISAVLNGGLDNVNIQEAAGILASKLHNYPNDPDKVLRGDGTWAGATGELGYVGDFVPGNTYKDGDVAIKDGVAFLCVAGPTAVAPDPAPWGAAVYGEYLHQVCTAALNPVTTSAQTIPGTTLTLTKGTWLVRAVFDVAIGTVAAGGVVIMGCAGTASVTDTSQGLCGMDVLQRITITQQWRVIASANGQTIGLTGHKTVAGGSVIINMSHTVIQAQKVAP
jgi:hypothetical protein